MNNDEWLYEVYSKEPKREDKTFLILLVLFGCICLTLTRGWHVYMDPVLDLMAKAGYEVELPEWETMRESQSEDEPEVIVQSQPEQMQDSTSELLQETEPVQEPQQTQEILPEPEPEPEPEYEPEFQGPVFQTVGEEYFADAVFIGDSRTVGMYEYSSLRDVSTFYASVGLSVHKLFTAKIVEVPGQRGKITVEQALSENQFAKVYLMIGINEMGTGTPESFLEKYAECVNHIRELQPDAIIYLQGIMQVTTERSAQGDYITNEGITVRNEGIKALADDETIFYLEVNEAVCDDSGGMVSEYTHDGVHLKAQYIDLWKEYLKNHAVVRE